MTHECNVCCEKVKNVTVCNYCDFTACNSCTSRFILESVNPSCMNCKNVWNREMLTEKFGKTFMTKKYKEKREKDLFETEKALLPETQPYATAKKELDQINKEIFELQARLKRLKTRKALIQMGETPGVPRESVKTAKLNIKCPVNDCRGYVDSNTMTCGICNGKTCKECHEEIKGENHTCDPNTVETVKMMKKDTKSCPKCMEGIHKIEGCDQMYCTQCHTAFSWRTGEIVIGGRIHNPHYYEYLRKMRSGAEPPREIGDIPCGGIPNVYKFMIKNGKDDELMIFHRTLVHVEQSEIRNYRTDNRIEGNRDLRIKFLNNEITEKQFKTTLQRREKEREKKQEISQVLNTLLVAGSEILRRNPVSKEETRELKKFINDAMKRVSKLYTCTVPVFNEYGLIIKKKF